nr:MAK10-like protein [Tanacetum cinerariifolium]
MIWYLFDPTPSGEPLTKPRDKTNKESWALLDDLALYDNESWNDRRDFAKPVKAISMPHDVTSASDRHLIELENQFQRMMEAHLSQSKPVQVNKIASSYEIYSGPLDTQYYMEDHKLAFVKYASTHTDEARNKCEVTNKLDTFLKAFNDQMTRLLSSDTELKVGLLEETDDVQGLADITKSYPVGIMRNMEVHVGKLKLFEDFNVVDMKREPTCPLLVGRGFLAIVNIVIDCKKAKIAVGEGLTRSIFGVKELDFSDENEPYWTTIGKRESYKP